jgi:hypothetical protein
MDDYDSVARQEELARRLWEQQEREQERAAEEQAREQEREAEEQEREAEEQARAAYEALSEEDRAAVDRGDLLRRCREAIGLDHLEATTTGPLRDIVMARRLRRVEQGREDVPPKAWDAYARVLRQIGCDDLVAEITEVVNGR